MKNLWVVLGFLLTISGQVYAGAWSAFTTITEVYPNSNGSVFVKAANMENVDNCQRVDYLIMLKDNIAQDKIYSALLAAMATNQRVSYFMSGCSSFPVIESVRVRPPL